MNLPPREPGPTLETERLQMRPVGYSDVDELHELFTHADVRRYLLDDQVVSREWVEHEVRASMARFEGGSAGLWALREKGVAQLMGFAGFRPFFEPPELQLLYGLDPTHWGRGLATEAARAAVSHAFDQLGFAEIRAATDTPNTASRAVLETLGMREWQRTDEGRHGTVFFSIRAPRARNAR